MLAWPDHEVWAHPRAGNGQLCGPLPPRNELPVRNAEEWNSTNVNAPPERMPLEACPRPGATEAAAGPLAGPDGRPLPLPALGLRGGPPRPGDSRASIDRTNDVASQAEVRSWGSAERILVDCRPRVTPCAISLEVRYGPPRPRNSHYRINRSTSPPAQAKAP